MPKQQKKLLRDETCLVLEPVVDVSHVSRLHAALDTAVADGGRIVIDSGRVERIDAAAMQLLSMAQRHALACGVALRWTKASPAFVRADKLLGLNLIGEHQP